MSSKNTGSIAEIINLDGTTFLEEDLSKCTSHAVSGKLVIIRGHLQSINLLNDLEGHILGCLQKVSDPNTKIEISQLGLQHIHNFLDQEQIKNLYHEVRIELSNKMPAISASMFRELGCVDPFYVHDASLIRIMLPYHLQKEYKKNTELGKLTLHGPHHDFYQNVPLNALNTWIALVPIEKENSMFIYPDCWGKRVPQENGESAAKNQYLGKPYEFSMEKGDTLLFHSNHMHASRLNTTNLTRVVLTNRVCTDMPIYPYPDKPQKYLYSSYLQTPNGYNGIFSKPGVIGKKKQLKPSFKSVLRKIVSKIGIMNEGSTPLPPEDDFSQIRTPISEDIISSLMEGDVRALDKKTCAARSNGDIIRFSRYCPHQGADLSLGYIEEGQIICPYHGAKFSLETGIANCQGLKKIKIK